jgi:integrase
MTKTERIQGTELITLHGASIFPGATLVDDVPLFIAWQMATSAFLDSKTRDGTATAHAYKSDIRFFFSWARCDPWEVTAALANEYAKMMRAAGRAEATINRRLAALSSLYSFVQKRYTYRDRDGRDASLWPADRGIPFDAVERSKISPYGRAIYPSTDELKRILNSINPESLTGKRDLALLYTIATTCLRSSAVLQMKWGDIEPRADRDHNLRYRYKGGDIRRAVLPHEAYTYITAYLAADDRLPSSPLSPRTVWGEGTGVRGDGMQPDDRIFIPIHPERALRLPNVDPEDLDDPNRAITNSFANRILKKYACRAGVDPAKAHIHGLRHAGARLRVELAKQRGERIDLLELSRVLGHSSIAVTQIYADRVLEDPEDPGLAAAAAALRPGQRRRRPAKPKPEQPSLLEAK